MSRLWSQDSGATIAGTVPPLHPRSWVEAPVIIQAMLAPHNLIQIGAFTGIYGGRIGHCRIGRYCSIAPGVDIASDQHPTDWLSSSMLQYVDDVHGWGRWLRKHGEPYHPPTRSFDSNDQVQIGNDVWIGQGAFIKSGVRIGDGAIIAAHSVVVDDVPAYGIVAGVPARLKRSRFEPALVERLLELQWWKYNLTALPGIDFRNVPSAVDRLSAAIDSGELRSFNPPQYRFTSEPTP